MALDWVVCQRCNGSGQVPSIIEGVPLSCGGCGGHGEVPEGTSGSSGFYRGGANPTIALLSFDEEEDRYRISFFDQSGPYRHSLRGRDEVMRELSGFRRTETSLRLLDYWATRPRWEEGLRRMILRSHYNLFSFHGLYNLCRQVGEVEDLEEAIQLTETRDRDLLREGRSRSEEDDQR